MNLLEGVMSLQRQRSGVKEFGFDAHLREAAKNEFGSLVEIRNIKIDVLSQLM